jgi:hypothetical protein
MDALILSFYLMQYIPPEKVCTRWYWIGDVYNRKVYCLEWKERTDPKDEKKKKTVDKLA